MFLGFGIGNPIFSLFFIENDNGDPWGIWGFWGEGMPNIKQIVEKSVKKSEKRGEIEKKKNGKI